MKRAISTHETGRLSIARAALFHVQPPGFQARIIPLALRQLSFLQFLWFVLLCVEPGMGRLPFWATLCGVTFSQTICYVADKRCSCLYTNPFLNRSDREAAKRWLTAARWGMYVWLVFAMMAAMLSPCEMWEPQQFFIVPLAASLIHGLVHMLFWFFVSAVVMVVFPAGTAFYDGLGLQETCALQFVFPLAFYQWFIRLSFLLVCLCVMSATSHTHVRQARDQLQRLAGISHELMTPLHHILSQLPQGEEQTISHQSAAIIRASGSILAGVAQNLLAASTLSDPGAGNTHDGLDQNLGMDSFVSEMDSYLTALSITRADAPMKFSVTARPHALRAASVRFRGSGIRLVCANLSQNAMKFTPQDGQVEVDLFIDAKKGRLRMAVADTGPGIPLDVLSRIFEQDFAMGLGGPDGSGLGLPIVRGIVEDQLEGRITYKDRVDFRTGAVVVVDVPIVLLQAEPDSKAQGAARDRRPRSLSPRSLARMVPSTFVSWNVALIDDNQINLVVLQRLFLQLGFEKTSLHLFNSAEALLRAIRATAPRDDFQMKYDIFVTDVQMPGMTGIELADELLLEGVEGMESRIAFCTSKPSLIPRRYEDFAKLDKPLQRSNLEAVLKAMSGRIEAEEDKRK